MNFLHNMALLLSDSSTNDGGFEDVANQAYKAFLDVVNVVLPIIIGVVLVFGLIYSIILGVNYAKAEDTNARDEAKKRLIGAIVGVVVAAVLMAIIWIVLSSGAIEKLFEGGVPNTVD